MSTLKDKMFLLCEKLKERGMKEAGFQLTPDEMIALVNVIAPCGGTMQFMVYPMNGDINNYTFIRTYNV